MELSGVRWVSEMGQTAYIRELLSRYHIEEAASVPISKWTEPETARVATTEEVREAQTITGALHWLSTRTRPDLAYVLSKCGQQATTCPTLSVGLGKQASAYLRSTIEVWIDVPFVVGP